MPAMMPVMMPVIMRHLLPVTSVLVPVARFVESMRPVVVFSTQLPALDMVVTHRAAVSAMAAGCMSPAMVIGYV